jgi:peptidyl-prolyl cis-trans isomerase D
MLEAIRDRAQGWFAKIILALLVVPFALWGMESYLRQDGGSGVVASVDGQDINVQQFNRVLNNQRDQLRQKLGAALDPDMLDSPQLKQAVLNNLIDQLLLATAARRAGLMVPDAQVAQVIAQIPAFQKDGHFFDPLYRALLRSQNMVPASFVAQVRRQLVTGQLLDAFNESAFAPRSVVVRVAKLSGEQRQISEAVVSPRQLLGQVKLAPGATKAYYDSHRSQFVVPERVRVEYLVLSPQTLMPRIQISDAGLKSYYQGNAAKYGVPEQREAAHILIALPPNPSAAQVTAARKKAQRVLRLAKQAPATFAQLAKKYSQDPGSARDGGELGFFGRKDMVKPFADAVFAMSVGQIRGPVQSKFGFHIIKLQAIKPARVKAFAQVKNDIAAQLKKQAAERKFAEVADNFSNTVYEQADSLKGAAAALGLNIRTSGWISRKGGSVAALGNKKLLDAIFSADTLKDGHNTEAIEVAPNTLVSARVVDHQAAASEPFAQVSAGIAKRLRGEQAEALAQKRGQELLSRLQHGKLVELRWSGAKTVGRSRAEGLSPEAQERVFRVDVRKLPAYFGMVNSKGGYTLFRVDRVIEAGAVDEAKRKAFAQAVDRLLGEQYVADYQASLRQGAKIEVKQKFGKNKEE